MSHTEHDYEFITESPTSMAKQFEHISSDNEEIIVEVKTKKTHKRKAVSADDGEVEVPIAPPKKRKRRVNGKQALAQTMKKPKVKTNIFDEEEDDEPSKQITIHLFIESTVSTTTKSRSKTAVSSATKTLQ